MSEVMRWKLKGFLPGVEGMCKAVMRPEVVMASDYDAAQSELAALREELAKANDKIDQAWNRKSCVDHKGFIPGALDAWKRPVPQDLPYDFSGNPGASATQYCNGWNDSGSYWSAHANELQQRLTAAEQRNEELESAVKPFIDYAANVGRPAELGVYGSNGSFEITREDWQAISALKPTESAKKEKCICAWDERKTCGCFRTGICDKPTESGAIEVAKLALSFENQRITPARFKCLACGNYHEGSGNLPCPKMSPMSRIEP